MVQFDVKRISNGSESFMVSFDFAKTPITQVADYIIIAASKHKASDIHFDPRSEGMMVRFRIDGDCQDYTFIPKAYEKNLSTRLKLLANMNITETRLPQDGAIKGEFGGTYLDMRVACLPTNKGEKIVIRILDYTRSLQGVDSLGFHPKNLEKIKRMMGIPNGIILVTGATGSGKSTTTYSMLSELNKPEVNVITVEDPVEMDIEGINQVQVNAEIGMTFAAALRSILREDPNVILIGEIRDSETAQIAVRASITGHLVMSTLHTNSALATVERLLDMNVERYLLSTALTGIISQRLAKKLCPDCRYQRETTPYEKKVFKKFLHQDVERIWDANPKGCEHCRKGYKGRIAVHEVLELDDHIRNALNDDKMAKEDFSKMIYTGKTISMLQDALIKALNGETSFEEVYRTIEIENEDEDNYVKEISEFIGNNEKQEEQKPVVESDSLIEETPTNPLPKPIEQLTLAENTNKINPVTVPVQQPVTQPFHPTVATPVTPQVQTPVAGIAPIKPVQQPVAATPVQAPVQTPVAVVAPIKPVQQPVQTPVAGVVPIKPVQQPIVQSTIQPVQQPINKIEQKPVEIKKEQPNSVIAIPTPPQPQQLGTPLAPTIELKKQEEKVFGSYKIVMPNEEEKQSKPTTAITPIEETKKENQNELKPIANAASTLEQFTIKSGNLDDDEQQVMSNNLEPNALKEIVSSPIPITAIQQLDSPIYATSNNNLNTNLEIPSFETATNPTDLANQLRSNNQPVITNDAPIQNIQAVSLLPSLSEEVQEKATGAEVLNDPGIRIAEEPIPVIPTLDTTSTQIVLPLIK